MTTPNPVLGRRALLAGLAASAGLATVGCGARGAADPAQPLTVMASAVPQTEILTKAQELGLLGEARLQVRELSGDVDPNQLLEGGDIDANFFQHRPYLDAWQKQNGANDLVMVAPVHVEPLGLYSHKVDSLAALPRGARIALAADPTNQARGLALLQAQGLVGLDQRDPARIDYARLSVKDVVNNPRGFRFVTIDRPRLPDSLDDASIQLSVINGANALEAGIKPAKDALVLESMKSNPFVNGFVVKAGLKDDPRVANVATALTSPELAAWIRDQYAGSVVPVN